MIVRSRVWTWFRSWQECDSQRRTDYNRRLEWGCMFGWESCVCCQNAADWEMNMDFFLHLFLHSVTLGVKVAPVLGKLESIWITHLRGTGNALWLLDMCLHACSHRHHHGQTHTSREMILQQQEALIHTDICILFYNERAWEETQRVTDHEWKQLVKSQHKAGVISHQKRYRKILKMRLEHLQTYI